jgi:hypothetical protein
MTRCFARVRWLRCSVCRQARSRTRTCRACGRWMVNAGTAGGTCESSFNGTYGPRRPPDPLTGCAPCLGWCREGAGARGGCADLAFRGRDVLQQERAAAKGADANGNHDDSGTDNGDNFVAAAADVQPRLPQRWNRRLAVLLRAVHPHPHHGARPACQIRHRLWRWQPLRLSDRSRSIRAPLRHAGAFTVTAVVTDANGRQGSSSCNFFWNRPTATSSPTSSPTSTASSAGGATAICRDGTPSYSQHRRGTCSHHGGVSVWLRNDIPT